MLDGYDDLHVNRASILISTHSDDEIYLMGSMVMNYPFSIFLFTPFLGDMDKSRDGNQGMMLHKSLNIINEYRNKNNMLPIYSVNEGYGYAPNGLKDEDLRHFIRSIELAFNKIDKVDYYIRTCKSSHQNHCHTNTMANAVLRSPYLDKIDCILEASYPNDFAIGDGGRNTAFQDMTKEQVDILCDILDNIYSEKVIGRPTLSSNSFRKALEFQGCLSNKPYAQWYQVDRIRIYGATKRSDEGSSSRM